MSDIFAALRQDSETWYAREVAGGCRVYPRPGHERTFQDAVHRARSQAGDRYGVLAEAGPDGLFRSLTLILLT